MAQLTREERVLPSSSVTPKKEIGLATNGQAWLKQLDVVLEDEIDWG